MAVYLAHDEDNNTPDELWWRPEMEPEQQRQCHVYSIGAEFAFAHLGEGRGQRCLVIGSAMLEVAGLQRLGWNVVFADVRQPPDPCCRCVVADAAQLPFADETFDAVSSTCVLCHVGLGRYGDPLHENGDRAALHEIARVLKPGKIAAVMFGPCLEQLRCTLILGRTHRIYNPQEIQAMALECGLLPTNSYIWSSVENFRNSDGSINIPYSYITMSMRKEAKHGCL